MHINDVRDLAKKIYIAEAEKDGEPSKAKALEFVDTMAFEETVLATWMAIRRLSPTSQLFNQSDILKESGLIHG